MLKVACDGITSRYAIKIDERKLFILLSTPAYIKIITLKRASIFHLCFLASTGAGSELASEASLSEVETVSFLKGIILQTTTISKASTLVIKNENLQLFCEINKLATNGINSAPRPNDTSK